MLRACASRIMIPIVFVALGAFGAVETDGCPVCVGLPLKTDADHLLDGSCVALARLHPDDSFKYAPRTVLKGKYDGQEIELLVDSATRRVLTTHLDRHVLLVQQKPGGDWQSLGPIDEPYEALVRRLLAAGETRRGPTAAEQRWQFFLPLFGHSDQRIAELAYLELGRAPYPVIRRLGRTVKRETYAAWLEKPRFVEWRGLAILLSAQSDVATDRQRILTNFEMAERLGSELNLAAWIAAAIEVDPRGTLDQIEAKYLRRADRTPAEWEAVARALSLHGALPESEQRERIVACYGLLLRHAPQLAPLIARDLRAWQRKEWIEPLTAILQQPERLDENGARDVRRYLQAVAAPATGSVHD